MKKVFLTVFLLSFASSARAAYFECAELEKLQEDAKECDDNEILAEAGVECLERLQALVNTEAKKVSEKMKTATEKNVSAANNKQTADFAGSVANLGISLGTIDQLLKAAQLAKQAATTYEKNIYFPEDFEIAENLPGEIEEFVQDYPCFTENRETLQWVGEDIDDIIEDLQKSREEALKVQGKTKAGGSRLDASGGAAGKMAKSGAAKPGLKPGKAGKDKKSESTITGKIKGKDEPEQK